MTRTGFAGASRDRRNARHPRHPRLLAAAMAAAILGAMLAGCGEQGSGASQLPGSAPTQGEDTTTPPDPPMSQTVTGTVTDVTSATAPTSGPPCPDSTGDLDEPVSSDDAPCVPSELSVVGTVLVEEFPDRQTGEKFSFTVDVDTQIVTGSAGVDPESTPVPFGELRPGTTATVTFSGPVAESYPALATADVIAVVVR